MKVFEEVYEDGLLAGTHVMPSRWVDTMKTPTMWRSKYTAGGYERLLCGSSNNTGHPYALGKVSRQT